jgi:hypothetical protein
MPTSNLNSADLKAVGFGGLIREDVMNKIWDISAIPLPFTDMISSTTAKNSYKEWTTDELAAPDITNAVIDGADASGNNTAVGARVGNHCQISDKVVRVSYRADASDTIGRAKELSYQLMRRQQELRRDVEAILMLNQASVADDGNTIAGKAGGLASWLKTNTVFGAGGANGGFNTSTGIVAARTPATNRSALTETRIRSVIQSVYQQGGDPTVLMSNPSTIANLSQYLLGTNSHVAQITSDQGKSREKAAALGAVNVFVTDFGTIRMVPNRLLQDHNDGSAAAATDVFILDPEYLSIAYLKGYHTAELAKTGLANNRQMSVDYTLVVHTEKAHGLIADVHYGTAVTA